MNSQKTASSLVLVFALFFSLANAQTFTRQDSLRGSIGPERAWWDLQHYNLSVEVFPSGKRISGKNTITYTVSSPHQILQIDLQAPMKITKVMQDGEELSIKDEGNAHFIQLKKYQKTGEKNELEIWFEGQPREAVRPPWDGGFTWRKDSNGHDFIATSNQGIGASIWWPCKDHPADEPDAGVDLAVEVPQHLMDVSNGRLIKVDKNKKKKTRTFHWQVKSPINSYGININIGDYVHFNEKYSGEKGILDMDYHVLRENFDKAREQFKDARRMIEAFEYWFGPYPFYEDGYKLVEAPYLGMEHQSSVTYGNGYQNGYMGTDLSASGWGLKWDFIIIHESGHEWFANNITNKDVADMWIHESFTAYSENLFIDYYYGSEAAGAYVRGTRMRIGNKKPVIGIYGVNQTGEDIYYKGANMLHTIRQIINNDEKWREILRGLNHTFYHQTVTTKQIEDYISENSGYDLSKLFDQYLRDTSIPIFEYEIKENKLYYRWINTIAAFEMPLDVSINGKTKRLTVNNRFQQLEFDYNIISLEVDPDYYVGYMHVSGH